MFQEVVHAYAKGLVYIMLLIAITNVSLLAGIAGYSQGYYIGATFVGFAILGLVPAALRL